MKILSTFASHVTQAIDFVVEANRKAALINRLKLVIKSEEKNIDRAYIALGKYYFNHLRDKGLEEPERHCAALENSKRRLDRALTKLEELTEDDDEEDYEEYDDCAGCHGDCYDCYAGDESDYPEDEPERPEAPAADASSDPDEPGSASEPSGDGTSGEAAGEDDGTGFPDRE